MGDRRYTPEPPPRYGEHPVQPDSGGLFVPSRTSSLRPPLHYTMPPGVATTNGGTLGIVRCDIALLTYTILPGIISSLCFLFGIFYCFFGYRFFKASMFMTGFLFGSLVTYLICLEENLLPLEGKLGVAIGAGVLCGLITMLVQYVGLFMTGFHLGFLLAVSGLVIGELFVHPSTKWIPIGAVLGAGVILALLGLYFQRSVTILATAALGSTLLTVGVDYFTEQFAALSYCLNRLKAEVSVATDICWYTWIVFALGVFSFIIGATAQCCVTAKGYNHNAVSHSRRRRKANVERIVSRPDSPPDLVLDGDRRVRPNNFRHPYPGRRFNGDIVSQENLPSRRLH